MPIPILRWPFDALLLLLYQFVISGDQFFTKKNCGEESAQGSLYMQRNKYTNEMHLSK